MHFNEWMDCATSTEKALLAEKADTSDMYLYLMHKGFKPVSPRMAAKLEKATAEITQDRVINARESVTIKAA